MSSDGKGFRFSLTFKMLNICLMVYFSIDCCVTIEEKVIEYHYENRENLHMRFREMNLKRNKETMFFYKMSVIF